MHVRALGVALGVLAGCASVAPQPQVTQMLIVPDGVRCVEPLPERDAWLRSERPALTEVAAAYQRRGLATQESPVYRAYKAWQDAEQDHVKAAEFYGPGYVAAAACWS